MQERSTSKINTMHITTIKSNKYPINQTPYKPQKDNTEKL